MNECFFAGTGSLRSNELNGLIKIKGVAGKWTLEITLYDNRHKTVFHGHQINKCKVAYYRMYYVYAWENK